jgi:hypothetical protein
VKKFVAFILAVLYFTASSGVVFNVHYCMGKVSSVKVDNFSNSFCKCGKKETNNSCCSSEFKVVKLNGDYKATSSNIDSRIVTDILPVKVSLIDLSKTTSQLTLVLVANAPPPDPLNRLYIANCVFRV